MFGPNLRTELRVGGPLMVNITMERDMGLSARVIINFSSQIGGKKFGVAKKVNLVSVKVVHSDGRFGTDTALADGLDYVHDDCERHKQPCVISMSLNFADQDMASAARKRAGRLTDAGVHIVACIQVCLCYGSVDIWVDAKDIHVLRTGTLSPSDKPHDTVSRSGTSYGAAPVAGIVASLISLEGNLDPLHMKEKFKRMALYGKIPNLGARIGD
ncbi:hypothetical protein H0H93_011626 [Arthromyces matolae]|nr:hypothetical protein H0H93_011626 [Arthromyces matolae]